MTPRENLLPEDVPQHDQNERREMHEWKEDVIKRLIRLEARVECIHARKEEEKKEVVDPEENT